MTWRSTRLTVRPRMSLEQQGQAWRESTASRMLRRPVRSGASAGGLCAAPSAAAAASEAARRAAAPGSPALEGGAAAQAAGEARSLRGRPPRDAAPRGQPRSTARARAGSIGDLMTSAVRPKARERAMKTWKRVQHRCCEQASALHSGIDTSAAAGVRATGGREPSAQTRTGAAAVPFSAVQKLLTSLRSQSAAARARAPSCPRLPPVRAARRARSTAQPRQARRLIAAPCPLAADARLGPRADMAAPRAAALLLALVLAAQPFALCQVTSTVTVSGSVPSGALSPTSAVTMGVNLGACRVSRGLPHARALGAPLGVRPRLRERACLFTALRRVADLRGARAFQDTAPSPTPRGWPSSRAWASMVRRGRAECGPL